MILRFGNKNDIINKLENIKSSLANNLKIEVEDMDNAINLLKQGKKKEAKEILKNIEKELSELIILRKDILDNYLKSIDLINKIIMITGENVYAYNKGYIDHEKTLNKIKENVVEINKLLDKIDNNIKKLREDVNKERKINIKDNDQIFSYAIQFLLRFNLNEIKNTIKNTEKIVISSLNSGYQKMENINFKESIKIKMELLRGFNIPMEYAENYQSLINFKNKIKEVEEKHEKFIIENKGELENIIKKL